MELATQILILDGFICVSLCTNALRKGMNPSFHLGSLTMVRQSVYKKKNSDFKPAVFSMEINFISRPVADESSK